MGMASLERDSRRKSNDFDGSTSMERDSRGKSTDSRSVDDCSFDGSILFRFVGRVGLEALMGMSDVVLEYWLTGALASVFISKIILSLFCRMIGPNRCTGPGCVPPDNPGSAVTRRYAWSPSGTMSSSGQSPLNFSDKSR
jgi:hypothetical protein